MKSTLAAVSAAVLLAAPVAAQEPATHAHPAGIRPDTVLFSETTAPATLVEGLAGRTPGLHIVWSSGVVGSAPRVWSRGIRSFSFSTHPMVVVDGMMLPLHPVYSMAVGGQHGSPFDVLDPNEIESVTVLTGPAAAARYGARGASGVIEVRTRRQASGPLRGRAHAGLVAHSPGSTPENFGRLGLRPTGSTTPFCTIDAEVLGRCIPTGDVETENPLRESAAVRTGYGTRVGASLDGGSALGGFRVAASRLNEAGVLATDRRERTSLSFTGHTAPVDGLQLRGTAVHSKLLAEMPFGDNHLYGRFPNSLLRHPFGSARAPSLYRQIPASDNFYRNAYDLSRTRVQGQMDYTLLGLPWVTLGVDLGRETARSDQENRVEATPELNLAAGRTFYDRNQTLDERRIRIGVSPALSQWVRLRVSAGYEEFRTENDQSGGNGATTWEDRSEGKVTGSYALSTLELPSLRLSAGMNRSDHDLPHDRILWSWSGGATWRLAEVPAAAGVPVLRALAVRGAFGATERLPAGPVDAAPERLLEIEAGVDLHLSETWRAFGTAYTLRTDSLFRRSNMVSTNQGSLHNRGMELGVRGGGALPGGTGWWLNTTAAFNRNRYEASGPGFPGSGVASGPVMVLPGDPVGGYYARPISGVRDRNSNQRIDPGNCPGPQCEVTLGDELIYLGTSIPLRLASAAFGIRSERGVTLSMRLDHQGGVKRLNDTEAFRCALEICGLAYAATASPDDLAHLAALRMESPVGFVEDADFVKLREVALTLRAPERWLGTGAAERAVELTVTGRNLYTWTRYSGMDPETSAWGATAFGAVDFLTQPLPRSIVTRIDVRF